MLGYPGHGAMAQDAADPADRCASLRGVTLAQGKVTSASIPEPGATFDSELPLPPNLTALPFPGPICRVQMQLSADSGSSVRAELWLPLADRWNYKLVETGNGGFGGSLGDPMVTMRHAVLRGYAAAGNDMGHDAKDAGWMLRKASVTDYGWRADRLTSRAARTVLKAFYGQQARLTYFEGCSSGGRQALMAAERAPGDYDGIIAGAPAADFAGMLITGSWIQQQLAATDARPDPADLKLVGNAAMAQCDATDGLADGLISDPLACRFDPATLACGPADQGSAGKMCLSPAKVRFFQSVYSGVKDARGKTLVPGLPVGAETDPGGWYHWITKPGARHDQLARGAIGTMMLHDTQWTTANFELARDIPRIRRWFADVNVDTGRLNAFRKNGGRMIVYHGWADAGINPRFTLDWHDRVQRQLGRNATEQTVALFMMPGLSHCAGGAGPDGFQMLDALDAWRDRGIAPASIAGQWHDGMPFAALLDLPTGGVKASRPICRYPTQARWNGQGDSSQADSFVCQ